MENLANSDPKLWFAVHVRPHSEKSVAAIARYNGFEEFLPLYRSRSRWSGRAKALDLPLFPGCVFCRINPDTRLQLQTLPGVQRIAGDGKRPIPVDDAEMAALQATAQSGLPAEPWTSSKTGHRVRLKAGPLIGLEGLLVAVRKSYRLLLSVTILNRSIAVEIERDWATPVVLPGSRKAPTAFTHSLAERSPYV